MEHRVSRLEGQFDRLSDKMDKLGERLVPIEKDMATVKERLSHMPTKFELFGTVAAAVGLLTGIFVLIEKLA